MSTTWVKVVSSVSTLLRVGGTIAMVYFIQKETGPVTAVFAALVLLGMEAQAASNKRLAAQLRDRLRGPR